MSNFGSTEFLIEVVKDNIPGHSIVHKFGHNAAVGTNFIPVSLGGIYRTPQVSGAVALRIKAGGNAADTAAGAGAREVTFQGLDETGALVEEAVATAGAGASSATITTFIRMFRAWVSKSGTYASASAGSHVANIVIEDSGGVGDWGTIGVSGFAASQTEIGVYSVPLGYTAYLLSWEVFSDSSKVTDVLFFQRQNLLETVAPYTAMRMVFDETLEGGKAGSNPDAPVGPLPALTDLGFMAKVDVGNAGVNVDFELLLVADGF